MIQTPLILRNIPSDEIPFRKNYHKSTQNLMNTWWFQLFFSFYPYLRNDPIWLLYFKPLAQPPTSPTCREGFVFEIVPRFLQGNLQGFSLEICAFFRSTNSQRYWSFKDLLSSVNHATTVGILLWLRWLYFEMFELVWKFEHCSVVTVGVALSVFQIWDVVVWTWCVLPITSLWANG